MQIEEHRQIYERQYGVAFTTEDASQSARMFRPDNQQHGNDSMCVPSSAQRFRKFRSRLPISV